MLKTTDRKTSRKWALFLKNSLTFFSKRLDFSVKALYNSSMDLKSILTNETVNLHLKGTTNKAVAKACIMDREKKMSTGMKHGIAIPHGKTDSISSLVACIGISEKPVDFDSLDQEPARIFIMTLSPIDKTGPHLRFLAEVSLLFKSPEKRKQLLNAKTTQEVIELLTISEDEK